MISPPETLSPVETICMKFQNLLSGNNKKNISFNMFVRWKILPSMWSVNPIISIFSYNLSPIYYLYTKHLNYTTRDIGLPYL